MKGSQEKMHWITLRIVPIKKHETTIKLFITAFGDNSNNICWEYYYSKVPRYWDKVQLFALKIDNLNPLVGVCEWVRRLCGICARKQTSTSFESICALVEVSFKF